MAPKHRGGRQTWTSSTGVTLQKWSTNDDLCLLEAVKTTAPRASGANDWWLFLPKCRPPGTLER